MNSAKARKLIQASVVRTRVTPGAQEVYATLLARLDQQPVWSLIATDAPRYQRLCSRYCLREKGRVERVLGTVATIGP